MNYRLFTFWVLKQYCSHLSSGANDCLGVIYDNY